MTSSHDLPPETRRLLEEAFTMHSKKDSNSQLDKEMLRSALGFLGQVFPAEGKLDEEFTKYDANKDGLISRDEFFAIMARRLKRYVGSQRRYNAEMNTEEELQELFALFDKDKDGLITEEEFSFVLDLCMDTKKLTQEATADLMAEIDTDKDGKINFGEFKAYMKDNMMLDVSS